MTGRAKWVLGRLCEAALADGGLSDAQLLGQFVARHDDRAFAALVRRHGPMVLGVCRRVLRHAQDAEDAFQATFLVLARKAAAVARREAVGGWLHGVAYRAALGARAAVLRRATKEQQVGEMPHPLVEPEDDRRELLDILDRELAKLPEKYRLPVVLCELQGRSRREAARQLGLPEGTLSSRLATARKTLAARLSGYGATVSAAALAALFARNARAACVHGPLLVSTVRAVGGAVPVGVAALTEGVMKSMLLTKLKTVVWGLLLAASVGVGAVVLTYRSEAGEPAPTANHPPAATRPAADRDDLEALRLEVEALRLELEATKGRVQTLEDEARAQKTKAEKPAPGEAVTRSDVIYTVPFVDFDGDGRVDLTVARADLTRSANGEFFVTKLPEEVKKLADDAEAAAKKLQARPDDKEALEALEKAVERLKQVKAPKPAGN